MGIFDRPHDRELKITFTKNVSKYETNDDRKLIIKLFPEDTYKYMDTFLRVHFKEPDTEIMYPYANIVSIEEIFL